ncbi:hypothetical protein GCK72_015227 [Caenorhabditis remanei]|uniref:Unspecific monooxygenase n=1 Tax=Caenorhabditis remanei TaxID=31234 RepID=A0A6A5GUA1_CAERE|nr:hypothetical protein GCK72_015227 [Caenorhabditis remanei]KAF1758767.1 hypothetical protein GCK72_015227 [Caenorhabditis remanei]
MDIPCYIRLEFFPSVSSDCVRRVESTTELSNSTSSANGGTGYVDKSGSSTADPTSYFQVLIREIDNPSGSLLDGTLCTPFEFTGFGCNTLLTGGVAVGWWYGSCGNNLNGFMYPSTNLDYFVKKFDSTLLLGINMRTTNGQAKGGYDVELFNIANCSNPTVFIPSILLEKEKFATRSQYGPVYTFWMSSLPMVFVTDWKLIKQHFIKDGANFVGRPEFPINMEIRKGPYGIIDSFGNRWVQQRRYAIHILRDFGLGKNLMEEKVLSEVVAMIERLKGMKDDVDMQSIFDASVGSIINNLMFGYRFDESNMHEFLELKKRMNKHFKMAAEPMAGLVGMYPWLGNFPFFKPYKTVIVDNWTSMLKMFREQAEEKLATIDYDSDEYSDYVEAFLKERKKHEHEEGFGGFEMEQLDSVCFDLWVAGMETTSNTLYWSLLYVLLNPKVLEKVYEELDTKIGSDRIITTTDRPNLNYINATINETQRLANLLPMNLPHATSADVVIAGYSIPKDTVIIPQISSVMYDPEIFPEPYEFRPERFLESDGSLKKVEELVPFSIGKRQCLGEGLARMELF